MKTTIRRIVDLLVCPNETNSSIARKAGKHRDTIRKFRTNMIGSGLNKEELDRLDDVELEQVIVSPKRAKSRFSEPDFGHITSELKKPGVTIRLLYERYADSVEAAGGVDGAPMSESRFYTKLREFRSIRNSEYRHEHLPGESLQFDFSGKRPFYLDSKGNKIAVELAVSVLPYSGLTFGIALASQALPDCTEAFVSSLEYFGGVPQNAVFDNFKAAVDRPRRGSEPAKINIHMQACFDHYMLFPDPARGYRPRDKGMVEKMVQEVQRSFLGKERHLNCTSLADLNRNLQIALDEINHRPMSQHGGKSRWQIFENEERAALSELPPTRYEFGFWQVGMTVPLHYHVFVDGVGYSVSHRLIGQRVNIKASTRSIEIYANGIPVALHQRSSKTSGRVTNPDHLPANHHAMRSYKREDVIKFSKSLGEEVAAFTRTHLELHNNVKAAGMMLRKLSRKINVYGRPTVEAAICEATDRGQISALAVYNILERGRTNLQVELPQPAAPSGNIRGSAYYSDDSNDDHGGAA